MPYEDVHKRYIEGGHVETLLTVETRKISAGGQIVDSRLLRVRLWYGGGVWFLSLLLSGLLFR